MNNHPPIPLLEKTYGLQFQGISPMGKHLLLQTPNHRQFLLKSLSRTLAIPAGEALRHLSLRGLHPSPLWQKPLTKGFGLTWQGRCWVLVPWQAGSTAPAFSPAGFPRLLRLLNQVHEHGRFAAVGRNYDHAQYVQRRLLELEQGYPGKNKTEFTQLFQKNLPRFIVQAKIASKLLNKWAPATGHPTLCHGDPAPKNALVLPDRRWILIDWDLIVRAHRWWELSQAIRRFNSEQSWKPWRLWDQLANVLSMAPLTKQEKNALWAALLFPQEYWRLGYQFYLEQLSRPESWYLRRLKKLLNFEAQRQVTLNIWARGLR